MTVTADWREPVWPACTHVVPLGLSCRVTYQIRSYFRSTNAYPFDWWISPLDGMVRYLSVLEPDRIFGPEGLAEDMANGHIQSIVSREFGFSLFHDFPRVQAGMPMRVVSPGWRHHVAAVRERHLRRLERMTRLNAPGNRLLFVRDRPDDPGDARRAEDGVARLWHVLATRWHRAEVGLLLVNMPGIHPQSPRVRSMTIRQAPGPGAEAWRGDDHEWSSGLRAAGLVPPAGAPAGVAPPSPDEPD